MKKNNFFHNGTAYQSFDSKLSVIENELVNSVYGFLGYDKSVIAKRVLQRIVELKLTSYVSLYANSIGDDGILHLPDNENFSVKKLFSKYEILKSISEFYAFFLLSLLSLIKGYIFKTDKVASASLLFGLGKENYSGAGKKEVFLEYCNKGPVSSLFNSAGVIIQSTDEIEGFDRFYFHRTPLLKAIEKKHISTKAFLWALGEHFLIFFRYHYLVINSPILALLGRDLGFHVAAKMIEKDGFVKTIVFTNSNYASQPLWSNNFNTHMLWYSMNIKPLVFKADMIEHSIPNNRFMNVGIHWVWSDYYAEYLQSIGVTGSYKIVDPILWHLNDFKNFSKKSKVKKICIFDVTPVKADVSKEIGLINSYYNYEYSVNFLNDILDVCEELREEGFVDICIYLKPKREYHKIHDLNYIEYLDKLNKARKINFLEYDEDLYRVINESDMVISIPNSSPSLVAAMIGKRGIYYDSVGVLHPNVEEHPLLTFISNKEMLKKKVRLYLTN